MHTSCVCQTSNVRSNTHILTTGVTSLVGLNSEGAHVWFGSVLSALRLGTQVMGYSTVPGMGQHMYNTPGGTRLYTWRYPPILYTWSYPPILYTWSYPPILYTWRYPPIHLEVPAYTPGGTRLYTWRYPPILYTWSYPPILYT